MVTASQRNSRATIVSISAVGDASSFLQELPDKPKEGLSLREAVDQLRSQIQAAFAKGYSYEEVAQMLNEQGIDISASTLKNYVPSGKRQSAKEPPTAVKTGGKRRKPESESNQTIAEVVAEDEEAAVEPVEVPDNGTRKRGSGKTIPAVPTAKVTKPSSARKRGGNK